MLYKIKKTKSHAILYQAMLLAQKPETKIKILNSLREKLKLNGLEKIAEPVYFSELNKISNYEKDLVDKNLFNKLKFIIKTKIKIIKNLIIILYIHQS